jgi:hypothetical protein
VYYVKASLTLGQYRTRIVLKHYWLNSVQRVTLEWHEKRTENMKNYSEIVNGRVLLGRPRHVREDNIKIDLTEKLCKTVHYIILSLNKHQGQVIAKNSNIIFIISKTGNSLNS